GGHPLAAARAGLGHALRHRLERHRSPHPPGAREARQLGVDDRDGARTRLPPGDEALVSDDLRFVGAATSGMMLTLALAFGAIYFVTSTREEKQLDDALLAEAAEEAR